MKGKPHVLSFAHKFIHFFEIPFDVIPIRQKNQSSSSPFLCGNLNDAADHCVVPCVERVGGGDAAALHPAGAALRKRETRCIFPMFRQDRLFPSFGEKENATHYKMHWK